MHGIVSRLAIAIVLGTVLACLPQGARAGGGPLGIDHEWRLDQSGIWARNYQRDLEYGAIAVEVGGALWLGNDSRLGHVFWQSLDSTALSAIAATGLKMGFSRARPSQGGNPDLWFQGHGYESFPSGEVTLQASLVTPFIVSFHRDHPWVWALELLPLYDSLARLKSQEHWQTDVLAGWALGTGIGYWSSTFSTPLSVRLLPHGLSIGLHRDL